MESTASETEHTQHPAKNVLRHVTNSVTDPTPQEKAGLAVKRVAAALYLHCSVPGALSVSDLAEESSLAMAPIIALASTATENTRMIVDGIDPLMQLEERLVKRYEETSKKLEQRMMKTNQDQMAAMEERLNDKINMNQQETQAQMAAMEERLNDKINMKQQETQVQMVAMEERLQDKMTSFQRDITKLHNDLSTMQLHIQKTQEDLQTMQGEIGTILQDINAIQQEIIIIRQMAQNGNPQQIVEQVATLQQAVEQLAALPQAVEQLAALPQAVEQLKARVAAQIQQGKALVYNSNLKNDFEGPIMPIANNDAMTPPNFPSTQLRFTS